MPARKGRQTMEEGRLWGMVSAKGVFRLWEAKFSESVITPVKPFG